MAEHEVVSEGLRWPDLTSQELQAVLGACLHYAFTEALVEHADHQVVGEVRWSLTVDGISLEAVHDAAAALAEAPAAQPVGWTCPRHRLEQHRDAKPRWCDTCGLTAGGRRADELPGPAAVSEVDPPARWTSCPVCRLRVRAYVMPQGFARVRVHRPPRGVTGSPGRCGGSGSVVPLEDCSAT